MVAPDVRNKHEPRERAIGKTAQAENGAPNFHSTGPLALQFRPGGLVYVKVRVKSGHPLHRQRLFPHPKTIRRIRIDIPINRRLSNQYYCLLGELLLWPESYNGVWLLHLGDDTHESHCYGSWYSSPGTCIDLKNG